MTLTHGASWHTGGGRIQTAIEVRSVGRVKAHMKDDLRLWGQTFGPRRAVERARKEMQRG